MAIRVYSAAVGRLRHKDKSVEQVWQECTEMFRDERASSYMRGHWPLDFVGHRPGQDDPGVGSIFRCVSGMGATRFVKILKWRPQHSFSYTSAYLKNPHERRGFHTLSEAIDGCPIQRRMDFSLEQQGSEVVVTIRRRERSDISWWKSKTDALGDQAAENLSFILTGGSGIAADYEVKRDDSLRRAF